MRTKTMLAIAASGTLLAMSMPLTAQDTTMENPAPTPTEVPAPTPMPDPASPPMPMPAQSESMPMNAAPGTMPGQQNTMMTNPPPAAQAVYPPCSATLQDQCTNTRREADYKRGMRRPRRR